MLHNRRLAGGKDGIIVFFIFLESSVKDNALVIPCETTRAAKGFRQIFSVWSNRKQARQYRASCHRPAYSAAAFVTGFLPPGFFTATFLAAAVSPALRPSPALKAKVERWAA
jgi:hypothetical protein